MPAPHHLHALALGALALVAACNPSIAPGKAGAGEIGAACAEPTDCTQVSSPYCLKMGPEGYCASDCSSLGQFECASGSVCEELGDQAVYCVDGCCSDGDCRDGFRCARKPELDVYQDLTACTSPGVCLLRCTSDAGCEVGYKCNVNGECVPKKSIEAGVGAPCAAAADCNSGTCLNGFPGGYCTSSCGNQFETCEPGSDCYATTDGASSCYKLCQSGDDCRSGYRCQVVASSSETDKARGYCLPRCEADSCADGTHCDAASGACVDGAAEPGPIGAFCGGDGDCTSGDCDASQPNGYCTASCGSCDDGGVCVGGACRAACDNPGDCRFGYLCDQGACLAACRSDADCAGEQICNTASGKCVEKSAGGVVQTFVEKTITISDTGSEDVLFDVPEGALSAAIFAEDDQQVLIALNQVYVPGDTLVFDINDPVNSRFGLLPTEGSFSALLPPGPVFNFVPGQYRVSFLRDSGTADTRIKIFGKVSTGFPERQAIDVVLTFVGGPEGLNATSAQSDQDFQTAVGVFEDLYSNLGIDIGQKIYEDLGGSAGDALRTIDSTDGANNELSQLFTHSTAQGQGLNFFFVKEIVGGDEGYIILGVSGGIPGPPAIQGTQHSGVALSLTDFRDQPNVLGQTMAHEGGHYLGLFHTTESNGTSHDPLPDTAECQASDDKNFDGYLSDEECAGKGSDNFMFWLASTSSNKTSAEQGRVLRRNPGTK
ncbi:MAG: hypothetical protein U1F43_10665 [Myxococcota bacterium]